MRRGYCCDEKERMLLWWGGKNAAMMRRRGCCCVLEVRMILWSREEAVIERWRRCCCDEEMRMLSWWGEDAAVMRRRGCCDKWFPFNNFLSAFHTDKVSSSDPSLKYLCAVHLPKNLPKNVKLLNVLELLVWSKHATFEHLHRNGIVQIWKSARILRSSGIWISFQIWNIPLLSAPN